MFILFASMASKEELIKRMAEAISNYKEAKLLNKSADEVEKVYQQIIVTAHMFIVHHDTGGDFRGALDFIKKMDNMAKREKLFDTSDIKN